MTGKAYKFREVSLYTKAIAISVDDLKWIDSARGKKSKAGKLAEIIAFYKQQKGI